MSKCKIMCCTLLLILYTIPLSNAGFIYGIQNKNNIKCQKNIDGKYSDNQPVIDIFIWLIVNSSIVISQLICDPSLLFTIYCINYYPFMLVVYFCLSLFQFTLY